MHTYSIPLCTYAVLIPFLCSATAFQQSNPPPDVRLKLFIAELRVAGLFPDSARNVFALKAVRIPVLGDAAVVDGALLPARVEDDSLAGIASRTHILAIALRAVRAAYAY